MCCVLSNLRIPSDTISYKVIQACVITIQKYIDHTLHTLQNFSINIALLRFLSLLTHTIRPKYGLVLVATTVAYPRK